MTHHPCPPLVRNGRSCVDNLTILSNDIHCSFIHGNYTVAVFLDITGAFDNIFPDVLVSELESIGIPVRIRKFYENLTSQRTLHFVNNGTILDTPLIAYKGTPQGSVSSPILFNIYLRNIPACQDQNIYIYTPVRG